MEQAVNRSMAHRSMVTNPNEKKTETFSYVQTIVDFQRIISIISDRLSRILFQE